MTRGEPHRQRRRQPKSAVWCLVLAGVLAGSAAPLPDGEDTLKAAAVLGFLRYSAWPASGDAALTVGVLGRAPFAQVLRRTLEGKTVNRRAVRVIEYAGDPKCCQLLYFATGRAEEIQPVLEGLPVQVLTVGEDNRFLDYGGVVNLFLDEGHIAFEASLKALRKSGVSIHASLLRLGQIRGREKGAQ